jgi:hypothetical protein
LGYTELLTQLILKILDILWAVYKKVRPSKSPKFGLKTCFLNGSIKGIMSLPLPLSAEEKIKTIYDYFHNSITIVDDNDVGKKVICLIMTEDVIVRRVECGIKTLVAFRKFTKETLLNPSEVYVYNGVKEYHELSKIRKKVIPPEFWRVIILKLIQEAIMSYGYI